MNYLQPQTFGSIFRNTFAIYFRHWFALVAIVSFAVIPIGFMRVYIAHSASGAPVAFAFIMEMLMTNFVTLPLTVAVSDICIGLQPNVRRAYSRAFSNPGRVLGTYLAVTMVLVAALIALILPILIVLALYVFVGPVTVLEQLGGKAAFTRSRQLGRGFYLRNTAIFIVIFVLSLLFVMLAGGTVVAIPNVALGFQLGSAASDMLGVASATICTPILGVPVILIYYDMRARKEGYGAPQLTEDLNY